ncbi:MAG: hypothetical protein AB8G86_19555 [Saprospiraceae bacterium]
MKKIGIIVTVMAALTIGYLYFCGCCSETCCTTASTSCKVSDKADAPTYKLTTKDIE